MYSSNLVPLQLKVVLAGTTAFLSLYRNEVTGVTDQHRNNENKIGTTVCSIAVSEPSMERHALLAKHYMFDVVLLCIARFFGLTLRDNY